MALTYRQNFNPKRWKVKVDRRTLEAEMLRIREEVRQRARSGEGIQNNPLPGLSAAYQRYKTSVGRPGVRDFTLTGDLLNGILEKTIEDKTAAIGRLYFSDKQHRRAPLAPGGSTKRRSAKLASARRQSTRVSDVARGNQARTPFFGMSRKQVSELVERLSRVLGDRQ